MPVDLAGISLGHDEPVRVEQCGERPVEWPDRDVDPGSSCRRQQLAPAADRGLAHLIASKRPEHRARGGTARGRAIAAPVDEVPVLEPQAFEEIPSAPSSGPIRIEWSGKRNLLRALSHAVEISTKSNQRLTEIVDPGSLRIGRGQADREIEADKNGARRSVGLEPEPEVVERSDRCGRQDEITAARLQHCPRHPAFCGVRAPVRVRDQRGQAHQRCATMNSRRKGNRVRPSARLG